MDTIAIKKTLRKIAKSYEKKNKKKLFNHVCACDLLPKKIQNNQDSIIIVNEDTSDKPGSHWHAIWITSKKKCYFFDSYGERPNNKYIMSFMKSNSTKQYWNNRQLQSFYSYCCGEYCCMFAYTFAKTNNSGDFFNQFNSNLHKNDEKVQSMYTCTFHNRGCSQHCRSYKCK